MEKEELNVKKREKGVLVRKRSILKISLPVLAGVFVMANLYGNETFAAAADPVGAVSALKTLFLSILSGIGVIIAAKNGFEMFQAYQQQDSAGMSSALKGVIGGVGMAGIGAILGLMGL